MSEYDTGKCIDPCPHCGFGYHRWEIKDNHMKLWCPNCTAEYEGDHIPGDVLSLTIGRLMRKKQDVCIPEPHRLVEYTMEDGTTCVELSRKQYSIDADGFLYLGVGRIYGWRYVESILNDDNFHVFAGKTVPILMALLRNRFPKTVEAYFKEQEL